MAIDFKDFRGLKWYYQVIIVAGVCGGLLALFWYQYLTPIEADITAKTRQLDDLQRVIAKSMEQQKHLAEIKKQALALEAKLEELKSVLPLEKETDEVLRSVQGSASSSELKILRVGFRPTVDREVYTEWPIDMDVIGTYHNMGAFLDRIRQLPRIVNISGLKIQSHPTKSDDPVRTSVEATYTATTFVYREDDADSASVPKP